MNPRSNRFDDDVTQVVSAVSGVFEIDSGLRLTILWHPDIGRIGEQAAWPTEAEALALARYQPMFRAHADAEGAPLGSRAVSRSPIHLRRRADGGLIVEPSDGGAPCGLNGRELVAPVALSAEALRAGAVLQLGGAVLLCIHAQDAQPGLFGMPSLIGVGRAMAAIRRAIRQAAGSEIPVLILGETGTGKELVAQAIHANGPRASGPLVAVNMATLTESLAAADLFGSAKGAYTGAVSARHGLFAEADGGTLFLDEVGDTPAVVQPMLLRVLESGEYRPVGASKSERADVRLIAATDRHLGTVSFNQPLRRRLEALVIEVPPLRARREDIGLLLRHFLLDAGCPPERLARLPGELIQVLCLHDWPGNVRELRHVAQRMALSLRGDEEGPIQELFAALRASDLSSIETTARLSGSLPVPALAPAPPPSYRAPSTVSEGEVLAALEGNDWCVRQAATALGVSRPSFYALLDANPAIRRPREIPTEEIEAAMRAAPGRPERWAATLRTPREGLRRWIKSLGLG